jgi:regulator of sigma E protease
VITSYLLPALGFVFVFGITVLVHELGHFVFAKSGDVQVDAFSIGMGPSIANYQYGETTYKLSWLPIGGYVSMEGEDPEEAGDNPRAFYNKSVGKRMMILLAGCLFNFLLGYVIFVNMGMFVGEVSFPPKIGKVSETIKVPTKSSEANKTHNVQAPAYGKFQVGDRILSINGESINQWQQINVRNQLLGDGTRTVVVRRDGKTVSLQVEPIKVSGGELNQPRYIMGIAPYIPGTIGFVEEGSPADKLGFQSGDKIVSVNDKPVESWLQFTEYIRSSSGEVSIVLKRNGETLQRAITIPKGSEAFQQWVTSFGIRQPIDRRYYDFFSALSYGIDQTLRIVSLMYETVVGLINQTISPQTLAGPVGIVDMTGSMAQRGMGALLYFTAFFSINLGVINLLPIPALDGGHVFLTLPELFTGSALPERVVSTVNYMGMILLLTFILYVTKIDLCRYEFFTQYFGVICQ